MIEDRQTDRTDEQSAREERETIGDRWTDRSDGVVQRDKSQKTAMTMYKQTKLLRRSHEMKIDRQTVDQTDLPDMNKLIFRQ